MKTITVKKISKSYPNKDLFEDLSFTVQRGDRIAIVGENGTGKSTLLKIISGREEIDEGSLINDRVSVAYISQDFKGDTDQSVLEYLEKVEAKPKVFELIKSFGILGVKDVEEAKLQVLSGGQKRVVEICAVLSQSPMFLCIDEPENHLDMRSRSVLTQMLKNYWGSVLLVSHDRFLINEVSNKILAIEDGEGILTSGKTYEEFLEEKRRNRSHSIEKWKSESRAVNRLEDAVRELKRRTRYNDGQARTYQMKKRELERRKEDLGSKPLLNPKTAKIDAGAVDKKSGKMIVNAEEVSFLYPDSKSVLENVTFDLRFGQKAILLGRNGSGKTTLLELIRGNLEPSKGQLKLGNDMKVEYVDQNNTLDGKLTPIEHFRDIGFQDESARSILSGLLFSKGESETVFDNLSQGQKLRLRFSLVFRSEPEFIILDEPTNNLDPTTWDLLLDLVNEFSGTILLVSHDRRFVEKVEDKRLWVLNQGKLKEVWLELEEALGRV